MINKRLIWFFIIVSFLGFADATFLAITYYAGVPVPCSLSGGCDLVSRSPYAVWWGIPVSLVGALYYLVMLLAAVFYLDRRREGALKILLILPTLGFLNSLYLTYLQGWVIKAWCQYCLFSALTSTALFIASLVLMSYRRREPAAN